MIEKPWKNNGVKVCPFLYYGKSLRIEDLQKSLRILQFPHRTLSEGDLSGYSKSRCLSFERKMCELELCGFIKIWNPESQSFLTVYGTSMDLQTTLSCHKIKLCSFIVGPGPRKLFSLAFCPIVPSMNVNPYVSLSFFYFSCLPAWKESVSSKPYFPLNNTMHSGQIKYFLSPVLKNGWDTLGIHHFQPPMDFSESADMYDLIAFWFICCILNKYSHDCHEGIDVNKFILILLVHINGL